jgi:hypothetical protein
MIWTKRRFFVPALIALSALHFSLATPTPGQDQQYGKSNPLKLTVTLLAQHYCADRDTEDPRCGGGRSWAKRYSMPTLEFGMSATTR